MICVLCEGAIKRGQFWVMIRAFANLVGPDRQPYSEPIVLEDGSSQTTAHYGCLMKRAPPELLGCRWGESDLGEPPCNPTTAG